MPIFNILVIIFEVKAKNPAPTLSKLMNMVFLLSLRLFQFFDIHSAEKVGLYVEYDAHTIINTNSTLFV